MNKVFLDVVAVAKVTASGTATVLARGCSAAHTAAGVCTLTLDEQVDTTEGLVMVQSNTLGLDSHVTRLADNTVTITSESDAGVDTDCDLDVIVFRGSAGANR